LDPWRAFLLTSLIATLPARSALRDLSGVLYHKPDRERTRQVWRTLEHESIAENRPNCREPAGARAA
jgi:hypothetical protein